MYNKKLKKTPIDKSLGGSSDRVQVGSGVEVGTVGEVGKEGGGAADRRLQLEMGVLSLAVAAWASAVVLPGGREGGRTWTDREGGSCEVEMEGGI